MVENSSQLYMPVAPAYAANSGMGGGFGYNGDWWLILILLFAFGGFGGWGNGGFGGFGGANAQRDNQGRYADGYSRDGGYYAGSSNTKEELQRLMDKATNETEKEAIRVAIESMNN